MKKFFVFVFFLILSTASFAKECVISSVTEDANAFYNNTIATYTNIEEREGMITTIIKKNGNVITDFNWQSYYDGAQNKEEMDARTEKLVGTQVATIIVEKDKNLITLAIGVGESFDSMLRLNARSVAISDLTSSKVVVIDIEKKLTINCIE
jgi:hypothetical protein